VSGVRRGTRQFGDPVDREARSVAVAAEAFCDKLGELGFDCGDRRARYRLWPCRRRGTDARAATSRRDPRGARSRLQVMSTRHLDDLRVQARYARERYDLYKAKVYGPRPTTPARMRELQRECERAEARLRAAQAEERRVRITDDTNPNPS
jgi:hypothetical protein